MVKQKKSLIRNTFVRQPGSFGSAIKNFRTTASVSTQAPKRILKRVETAGTRIRTDYENVQTLRKNVSRVGVKKTVFNRGSIY